MYFALRFWAQGSLVLSEEEYYAISFEPAKVISNFIVGIGMGWSAVDGLAFFTKKYVLFGITVGLSMAGWLLLMISAFKSASRKNLQRMIIGVLIVFALVSPHCFFKYFHPAELHLYSVVTGVAIFVGCISFCERGKVKVWIGTLCLLLLFAVGWVDKIAEIYKRSNRVQTVLCKIAETGISLGDSVAFVVAEEPAKHCYSVFSQSVIHSLGENTALRSLNGWRAAKAVVITPDAIPSLPSGTDVIRLDSDGGSENLK